MDQRKLIKLGNSSFAIALPKDWVDKSGLKKGDNIFITPNSNGELIVQPSLKKINEEKNIEINVEGKDGSALKREISAHYVNGYNLFSIKGKRSREINEAIKKTFKDLVGVEIIKNEVDEIVAKDLLNVEEMNLSNFIRRIDNNLHEMFGVLIEGFNKKKISQTHFSDIVEADEDTNKFHLLISRIFSMGIDNPSILTHLKVGGLFLVNSWWFSVNLEHIGDDIKSVARIIKSEPIGEKDYENLTKLIVKLQSVYNGSLEIFYNKESNKVKTLELINEGKKLWEEFNKLTLNKNPTVAKIAMKLKESETFIYQNIKMVLNNRG